MHRPVAEDPLGQINHQTREVEGMQGPPETLDRGWGSCRDSVVLFAEAVRTPGFGARIVSGYPYTASSDIIGSTHAWVEVLVPGAGWIAVDPANRSPLPATSPRSRQCPAASTGGPVICRD